MVWRLGRDVRRLSIGDAPSKANQRVRLSLYYWPRANTLVVTREWIATNDIDQIEYAGSSHWPMVDRPLEAADVVASFCERVRVGPTRRGTRASGYSKPMPGVLQS